MAVKQDKWCLSITTYLANAGHVTTSSTPSWPRNCWPGVTQQHQVSGEITYSLFSINF